MMEKRLIKKVHDHDLLYKVDSIHCRDNQMRAAAWSDISQELDLPAEQCKENWRKLRNCYLNAINLRQRKNIPKWKVETEMSFLRPYIETRDTQRMNMTESPSHLSIGYNEDASEDMEDYDHLSPRCDSPEMLLPKASRMMMPFKRKFSKDEEDLPLNMPSSSKKRLDSYQFDETEKLFLSMSETVKRLRPVDQARVKKDLCNLIYAAEIKLLEKRKNWMDILDASRFPPVEVLFSLICSAIIS